MKENKFMRTVIRLLVLFLCAILLNTQTQVTFAAQPSEGKQLRFGMVLRDAAATWAPVAIAGVQDKAKEFGIEVIVMDCHNDSLLQIQLMESFLLQKVDGFIFAGSIDQNACNNEVLKYNNVGIPIVALDSAPTGGEILAFVGSDHEQVALRSAESMIELIKTRNNGEVPAGKILYIVGALSDDVFRQQDRGVHKILDAYPQLQLVTGEAKWSPVTARTVTADLITTFGNEKPVAVYIQYDEMMLGSIEAIKAAGWDPREMIIVTQDAGTGFEHLRNGNVQTWTTQRFYQSSLLGVQIMHDYITGVPIPKVGDKLDNVEGVNWAVRELQTGAKGIHVVPEVLVVPTEQSADWPGDTHNVADRLAKGLSSMP